MQKNIFEKYPKITIISFLILLGFLVLGTLELFAKKYFGLGNVIVYQSHPLYGYRPLPNQTTTRDKNTTIHINNLGLRAEEDWETPNNNPKQKRVLFLGDSVTYGGSYIDNQQLFSHLAVKNLYGCTSANAGVNAWGVSNIHGLIKENQFTPAKIYVTVLPEGDFYRGLNRIGGQPFWSTQPKWALEELLHYFLYKFSFRKNPGFDLNTLSETDKQRTVDQAMRHLKELDSYLTKKNYHHYIYITPSREQLFNNAPRDKIIAASFNQYKLKPYYLDTRLKNISPSAYHDDIHLSAEGHAIWADLMKHDLTPLCKK